ncbi:protein brambleberry isoform X2 [Strongylocentrotus purpuratus]|uniref:Protein brambleberry n=1 Tax=Strongylocentrotus purpuratus TaxID=7668 RepID=A0A7M7NWE8_STRPU|nr:protein brambleberry isoform X2 [Strongylocentrotus purpuratus]
MKILFIHFGIIMLFLVSGTGAFFSWIFGSSKQKDPTSAETTGAPVGPVPFEVKSADEKFLSTGSELLAGLSELDVCHHTVVYELKGSCNEMSEEELAKLGVRLLNCQSAAEGRPTYRCTHEMTVAECTKNMDPNTWNAYHIVSNRARSVCYAVRQQQFQRQTQFAVNQLASSAEGQLHLMQDLKNGQEDLNSMATDTFHTISEGQEKLVKSQEMIGNSQSKLRLTVESNMRDLTREKALIAAGHQELAAMTSNIRKQLDEATHQLLEQDIHQANKHQEVLEDLSSLSLLAKDVWNKLDHNMEYMHTYQEETAQHYHQTLDNLKKMNNTIEYLLHVMEEMQNEINHQLGWVTQLLTWTGENMSLLVTCVLHTCYFFMAAVLCSFLNTPTFSRLVLLLVVPLNAAAEIRQGTSLDFPSLSFFITSVVMANWVALWLSAWRHRGRAPISPHTLYLPDLSCINGSPPRDLTYEPHSFGDSDSGLSSNRRLHSTGFTSMLSAESTRNMTSLLSSTRHHSTLKDTDGGFEDDESDSDVFSSDQDDDNTINQTSNRTLTVTNLSLNSDPTPEPSPMPNAL